MQVGYTGGMSRPNQIMPVMRIIIAVLAVVLVILVFFFVRQYTIIRRNQVLSARELWISNLFHQHGPPMQSDVAFVQPWMTFDYVNQLFHIAPGYLKGQLSISDPNYPRITISSYARHSKLDVALVLASVDQALIRYLAPPTSTAPHP